MNSLMHQAVALADPLGGGRGPKLLGFQALRGLLGGWFVRFPHAAETLASFGGHFMLEKKQSKEI
jgi:hypothetical protein